MPSLLGSDDHWFTLLTATIVVGVLYGAFSVPWYWALVAGMIVSGVVEFAIKEVPPETDAYDPNQYQLWHKAFGDPQDSNKGAMRKTPAETDGSLDTLRNRYANGELTDEQFEQKVEKVLESKSVDGSNEREKAHDVLTESND
ncbi:SHOCT domain-containing protein [Haladaptatus caseinilyticus]|uniref:SHOCT domain-containing protein n=1 Tax=Haladaptatus caseinilyticus TaxID=2993314 RepID=UPI00224B7B73|nr:SHOCT domain-containing protein [Haladaptatus caseinilyticus]